ncbi:predicted protein [Arabidopsis lyrata subsp. lyrata]|uniref:Predicted protein n=1 Tax=Arabidopsis lyrata subsp. lyrata TaxID=81972 RepID=D7MW95_ARALL|nr:predicted protein [Arabidopsis lyrata subsp. lyrata]
MVPGRVKMNLNRKGKDIMKKKKTRVPCNFCEFSSSRYGFDQSLQDQEQGYEISGMYVISALSFAWQQFFSSSYEFLSISCLYVLLQLGTSHESAIPDPGGEGRDDDGAALRARLQVMREPAHWKTNQRNYQGLPLYY